MRKIIKKSNLISCLVLMIITTFSIINAQGQGVINLPQTGQTKCYDSSGTEINCSGTGQDREIKAGVALPSPHQPSPKFTVGKGAEPDRATKTRVVEAYGKLPLHFEANQGQVEGTVRFVSRGSGYRLFLTSTEAVLTLGRANQASEKRVRETVNPVGRSLSFQRDGSHGALNPVFAPKGILSPSPLLAPIEAKLHTGQAAGLSNGVNPQTGILRMKWEGANQNPRVEGVDELEGKSHYFIGNDPDQWRTNIPLYRKVRYRDLYPGIDLIYYGNQRQLEYDLVVTPEGDPGAIRLVIEGAEGVGADEGGNLILRVGGGEVIQQAPRIYQEVEGKREFIKGGYVVDSLGKKGDKDKVLIGFKIDKFDTKKPLIIDPVLAYSTYLGGSSNDSGHGIAVDSSGSAYLTGRTSSTNFPTLNPIQVLNGGGNWDAFVTKLNPAGSSLVYSTYLGGSSDDSGEGIAVDSSGSAYITGWTTSTNFPTLNPIQGALAGLEDAFITKLNPAGSALVYSTYLGGSNGDYGYGIAVDTFGSALITGWTTSINFPTLNPIQGALAGGIDILVSKLNPAGAALVYSTYLGGTSDDHGYGIAVDTFGSAYITGETSSTNFPTANPIYGTYQGGYTDAFVTKLNSNGSTLIYSTYLGGSDDDAGHGIAVDGSGSAYITGYTFSTNFPTVVPIQGALAGNRDVFVTKLNPAGAALVYSTYLGGNISDVGFGIAVDGSGSAYVTGATFSTNFPTLNPIQGTLAGLGGDAFVAKLQPYGSPALAYSTYLGGSSDDYGYGIAVDGSGNAYIIGATFSTNFPTLNPIQGALAGGYDAFVTRLDITETISTPTTPNGPTSGITGTSYLYQTGGSSSDHLSHSVEYQFNWGGGIDLSPWGSANQSKTWTSAGTYNVTARARCTGDTSMVSGWSVALSVTITSGGTGPALRDLPDCYTPSAPLTVTITVTPSATTFVFGVYQVEETPPNGWTVSDINENGQWDNINNSIKWSFFDKNNRTLTYKTTPPSGETGTKTFSGRVILGEFGEYVVTITGDLTLGRCPSETISIPAVPSGPTSGTISTNYTYSTGGSTSNFGHSVEYQFDWKGDGSDLSPWGSANQSKTWTSAGTYNVTARARCTGDTSMVSGWSVALSVTITSGGTGPALRDLPDCYTPSAPLTVTITVTPSATTFVFGVYQVEETPPNGWTVSDINENGQWDNINNSIKWSFFDKNNRTLTYKTTPPSGETGTKTFSGRVILGEFGEYVVTITGDLTLGRCPSETISIPAVPSGPTSGSSGTSYSYTTGGSTSNLGHSLEYQFDWKGDGTDLSPWGSATQSKIWTSAGTYNVRARARCATDTAILSNWSSGLSAVISSSTASVHCDFNSDGKTDILWRNKSTGQNVVWFMNGTTYSNYAELMQVTDTNWQIVGTGDFNGDGKTDVLWRNTSTGQNVVWLMDGVNYGGYVWRLEVADLNWEIVGTADFNGDGKTDILWRNKGTGQNVVWLMDGATMSNWSWILPEVPDTNWEIVGTGDFNGDGKTDILWRNKSTGQNVVWLMNGTALSSYTWLPDAPDTNWEIVGPK